MARRRRAVERATQRRVVVDRIVTLVLVVVAASGLMSILPSQSQVAVSRLACRAVSLGLGGCGAPGLDLQDTQLTQAQCGALTTLDRSLPEVRVRELTADQDLPVSISTARSGDVTLQLGSAAQPDPPSLLDGEGRPTRPVLDGVTVPAQAEWFLPRGQGLEQTVVAAQDGHHMFVQERSGLALVSRVLGRRAREVQPPSVLYSEVDLSRSSWPRLVDGAAPPQRPGGTNTGPALPLADPSTVTVQTTRPATLVLLRVAHQSAVVAPLSGRLAGVPVNGTIRWTRDDQGTLTSVLVAVVAAGRLAPGEPRTALPGAGVAYISIPVTTAPERALVQSWFSGPAPLTVPLDQLLGLRRAPATDRLGSFLTRAATITILRYGLARPAELEQRVAAELRGLRREKWEGVPLVGAATIAPSPNGGRRTVLPDPGCRT